MSNRAPHLSMSFAHTVIRLCSAAVSVSWILGLVGCSAALPEGSGFREEEVELVDVDEDWRDETAFAIPVLAPAKPTRADATDAELEDERRLLLAELSFARANVGQAIETAKAINAMARLRCLTHKARLLATLDSLSTRSSLGATPDMGAAITATRNLVRAAISEARAC